MTKKAQAQTANVPAAPAYQPKSSIEYHTDTILLIGSSMPERIAVPVAFKCTGCHHDMVAITTLSAKSLTNFRCRPCFVKKGLDAYAEKRKALNDALPADLKVKLAALNALAQAKVKADVGMVS